MVSWTSIHALPESGIFVRVVYFCEGQMKTDKKNIYFLGVSLQPHKNMYLVVGTLKPPSKMHVSLRVDKTAKANTYFIGGP